MRLTVHAWVLQLLHCNISTFWITLVRFSTWGVIFVWYSSCEPNVSGYLDNSYLNNWHTDNFHWTAAIRTTATDNDCHPGQLPPSRTTATYQDNCHPWQLPSGQLPPSRTTVTKNNCHLGQLPPGQLPDSLYKRGRPFGTRKFAHKRDILEEAAMA